VFLNTLIGNLAVGVGECDDAEAEETDAKTAAVEPLQAVRDMVFGPWDEGFE
jgi:hypothetical protein